MSFPRKILFAEDDEMVRLALVLTLEDWGIAVTAVETGTAALLKLQEESFDVVISDLRLPGASGLEVMECAKKNSPKSARLLISGFADENAERLAESLGAVLLHKPFAASDVQRVLNWGEAPTPSSG